MSVDRPVIMRAAHAYAKHYRYFYPTYGAALSQAIKAAKFAVSFVDMIHEGKRINDAYQAKLVELGLNTDNVLDWIKADDVAREFEVEHATDWGTFKVLLRGYGRPFIINYCSFDHVFNGGFDVYLNQDGSLKHDDAYYFKDWCRHCCSRMMPV